jgi:hypothetical protein
MRKLLLLILILVSTKAVANSLLIETGQIEGQGNSGKEACKNAHLSGLNMITKQCQAAGGTSVDLLKEQLGRVSDNGLNSFCQLFLTAKCEVDFN